MENMVMSVYCLRMFLSSSKNLKREGKRSETIHAPVFFTHEKQMLTLKNFVKLFIKNHRPSFQEIVEVAYIDKETVQGFV